MNTKLKKLLVASCVLATASSVACTLTKATNPSTNVNLPLSESVGEVVYKTMKVSYVTEDSSINEESTKEIVIDEVTSEETVTEEVISEVDTTEEVNVKKHYYDIPLKRELQDKVTYYFNRMNIDLDESYFYALMYCESSFDPNCIGEAGDSGYCQILDKDFDYIYRCFVKDYPDLVKEEKFVYDVFNEKTNIACGIYYLNKCAKEISGRGLSTSNLSSSLTSYNRGVTGARNYFKQNKTYITNYSSKIIKVAHYIQENNTIPK